MKVLAIALTCWHLASTSWAQANSIPVDLSSLYNNRGIGQSPGDANFNGHSECYPAIGLPGSKFSLHGTNYVLPTYKTSGNDNLLSTGQSLAIKKGRYFSVAILAAAESAITTGVFEATYSDGSKSTSTILVPPWWNGNPGPGNIIFPYHFTRTSINWNRSMIYEAVAHLDVSKTLVSLKLPNVTSGTANAPGGSTINNRLHIFSLSMIPATAETSVQPNAVQLEVQYARSTQKWTEGTNKEQIIEVVVNNIGDAFVKAPNYITVSVSSPGLKTTRPGVIKRLRPGDQARVEVGVMNAAGVAAGTTGQATVVLSGTGVNVQYPFPATYGIAQYKPTYESVYTHESPSWYSGAKYGIFIHWGVYAVPGWGNSGSHEAYAEWYWWDLNRGPTDPVHTYQYHNTTYGPNVVYDDFIKNFTAANFNPRDWVNLFADAGAAYFVQVSKHHDGYAIFDLPATVSQRTSVALYPHRNLLKELFDAAKQYQPSLRRATYFSLPEWFHPDYKKYGFSLWPGGNATNPFTGKTLPYTGYVPVKDYVKDVIGPSMQRLADMGTEIMWCDIGGPNVTIDFASSWFNTAASQGRQVAMNNRCGLPGDFDTPEYARYDAVATRKWESNLGMDPFSYGYNRATPLASYMSANAIVQSLVDIISKNGNFLLDVGPQADGTILKVEQDNLRAAGTWIKSHAEAIFNTTYWFITPEEGSNIRFTQTLNAFYIFSLVKPAGSITLSSPIPWVQGDQVTVVGGEAKGTVCASRMLADGRVQFDVPASAASADQWVWVFKITY